MSEPLTIRSHTGAYTVSFEDDALPRLDSAGPGNAHFIIDQRVAGERDSYTEDRKSAQADKAGVLTGRGPLEALEARVRRSAYVRTRDEKGIRCLVDGVWPWSRWDYGKSPDLVNRKCGKD